MTMDSTNHCISAVGFPAKVNNRPGLDKIHYRIGSYADIRAFLLNELNTKEALAEWTHREADDPAIALLEGVSVLGDILTFYQENYANETFLRTATWRESVNDLVRLLGYRLSPGLGGKSFFAFEIKGDKEVNIPQGLPLQADLEERSETDHFQVANAFMAHPHLNQFRLYRKRFEANVHLGIGAQTLEVHQLDSQPFADTSQLDIQAGDRIVILPDRVYWDYQDFNRTAEIIQVKDVEVVLDRIILHLEGKLRGSQTGPVKAYKIGRSFKHFGHNAPVQVIKLNATGGVEKVESVLTKRYLDLDTAVSSGMEEFYSELKAGDFPLEYEVQDITVGTRIICTGHIVSNQSIVNDQRFALDLEIKEVRQESRKWGALNSATTVLALDPNGLDELDPLYYFTTPQSELQSIVMHEVVSPAFIVCSERQFQVEPDESFNSLYYYGTREEASKLAGRTLCLQKEEKEGLILSCTNEYEFFYPNVPPYQALGPEPEWYKKFWKLTFDQTLDCFDIQEFDEANPSVTVYGNLALAKQGKKMPVAILGNGDNRQTFQTYRLPKAPLTYHMSTSATPPEIPELEVYVNDKLWTKVDTFFGKDAEEQIYIVRQDSKGESWVQFGDGVHGARLPSGKSNVTASYKTGSGAYGKLKDGSKPSVNARVKDLKKVLMPASATGGAEPESAGNAREAAPGKVQSLGRMVSMQDYEKEALSIPGIIKAIVSWAFEDNMPCIQITVLMESGREAEFEAVRETLSGYNRCRGTQRYPIKVVPSYFHYIYLKILIGLNPSYLSDAVLMDVRKALGAIEGEEDPESGLFSLSERQIGQHEYTNRIEGVVQQVEGVNWVKHQAHYVFPSGGTPDELQLPNAFASYPTLACPSNGLFQLHEKQLEIQVSQNVSPEECSA
ncbi:MAG: hypothetical protein AAGA18_13815 [Verrucomicrobiota bacterium]